VNVRQIGIIGGALIIAAGAFIWMRTQAGANQPVAATVATAPPSKAQVLVAKKDLMVGERITTESLGWQDWPESGATSVAFFVQTKAPDALKYFENGIVRQEMVSGEPVTEKKIVAVDAAVSSMAALLTPGMRATSVVVTPDSSVAGFVLPNDRVDIVLTREIKIPNQDMVRTVTSTILENVRVLAIDQAVAQVKEQKAISGSTATVELSAADAEKLRLADKMGDISLMLRGYADAAGPTLSRTEAAAMVQFNPENAARQSGQQQSRAPETPPQPIPRPFQTQPPAQQTASSTVKVYRGGQ
jgi:pilus assembly protein CpaB